MAFLCFYDNLGPGRKLSKHNSFISSRQEVPCKKMFQKISQNWQEKICARAPFLIGAFLIDSLTLQLY